MGLFSASALTCDQEFFFNQCFNLDERNERLIAGYNCICNVFQLQHLSFQETFKKPVQCHCCTFICHCIFSPGGMGYNAQLKVNCY